MEVGTDDSPGRELLQSCHDRRRSSTHVAVVTSLKAITTPPDVAAVSTKDGRPRSPDDSTSVRPSHHG